MLIRQLSVFVENKKGKLEEILSMLGENGIDICALSLADTTDYGILRVIVDDVERAKKVLEEQGEVAKVNHVIGLSVDDVPGGLAKALEVLKKEAVGIEYMYAFVGKNDKNAMVVLRTDNNKTATDALTAANISILKEEDICVR